MGKTALLVVHGIGSQPPGEPLEACASGLRRVLPEEIVETGREPGRIFLTASGRELALYEVHWADLLQGARVEKSFYTTCLDELAWFPWLNWKHGLLDRTEYPRWLILARTAQLVVVGLAGRFLYEAAAACAVLKTALDENVADVWNYAESLQGALAESSPLRGAGEEILERFRAAVEQARVDGCDELQIAAHSLGTVVAFNGLTRYPESLPDPDPPLRITRLYTIGSPLEKIRFLWPALLKSRLKRFEVQRDGKLLAAGRDVVWENFFSVFDLVSGRLKRFKIWSEVDNRRVWGLGGLATAHESYFPNPAVARRLVLGLTGAEPKYRVGWRERAFGAVKGTAENLLLPVLLVLALLLGLSGVLLVGTLGGFLNVALVTWLAGLDHVRLARLSLLVGVVVLVLYPLGVLATGYRSARQNHERFWRK